MEIIQWKELTEISCLTKMTKMVPLSCIKKTLYLTEQAMTHSISALVFRVTSFCACLQRQPLFVILRACFRVFLIFFLSIDTMPTARSSERPHCGHWPSVCVSVCHAQPLRIPMRFFCVAEHTIISKFVSKRNKVSSLSYSQVLNFRNSTKMLIFT